MAEDFRQIVIRIDTSKGGRPLARLACGHALSVKKGIADPQSLVGIQEECIHCRGESSRQPAPDYIMCPSCHAVVTLPVEGDVCPVCGSDDFFEDEA